VAGSRNAAQAGANADPERVGLVWMDAEHALIARWRDEPVIETLESGVPPRRTAVGSIRRGPSHPTGGGRGAAQRTEGRHLELMRRYLAELADRVADLEVVEVSGRGQPHARFADLLRRLAAHSSGSQQVTTRSTARRPTDPQLIARLRRLSGEELPRRTSGPYRPVQVDPTGSRRTSQTGSDGIVRRNPRPRRLPERREIDLEVEMMLADVDAPEPGPDASAQGPAGDG
jgi:hypothetical protein